MRGTKILNLAPRTVYRDGHATEADAQCFVDLFGGEPSAQNPERMNQESGDFSQRNSDALQWFGYTNPSFAQ